MLRRPLEQFIGEVRRRSDPWRSVGQLAGLFLGEANQVGNGSHGQVGANGEHQGRLDQPHHRYEIRESVVSRAIIEMRVHRQRAVVHDHQGAPVRGALRGRFHADVAAGAGSIVDDDGLAQRRAELFGDPAGADVPGASRRPGRDDPDRPCRILLRLSCRRQCDADQCQEYCQRRLVHRRCLPDCKRSTSYGRSGREMLHTQAR